MVLTHDAETAPSSTETPVPIPEGAIDLTPEKNGGLYKVVKRPGSTTAHPAGGDTVYVHYVGTLPDGTQFDSSRDRGEMFSFTLGRNQVIKGWDLSVATMTKGELCQIIAKPDYAYGAAGAPPRIPPHATLIFEIELFSWEGEDISPDKDKSISRSIQQEGKKLENPNAFAKINAYIVGMYQGRKFFDQDVEFLLGEATELNLPEGIDKALKKFSANERSLIHVKPQWGYGKEGNAEFQIPPNAELDFDITLKDFERSKEPWSMSDDEKLEAAEKLKARGTDFFQKGKYKLAAGAYNRVIELLPSNELGEETESKEKSKPLFVAAHNNLAMVLLKIGETLEAVRHCDKALEQDSKNVKALYRRGQAYQAQNDFEDAIKSYEQVLQLEPENKAAQSNIGVCRKLIAEENKRQKQLFANMFERLAKNDTKTEAESANTNSKEDSATDSSISTNQQQPIVA